MRTLLLLLAVAGAVWCEATAEGEFPAVDVHQLNAALQGGGEGGGARGQQDSASARWLRLLEELVREQTSAQTHGVGDAPRPYRLDLPLRNNGLLPVLVVPLVLSPDKLPPPAALLAEPPRNTWDPPAPAEPPGETWEPPAPAEPSRESWPVPAEPPRETWEPPVPAEPPGETWEPPGYAPRGPTDLHYESIDPRSAPTEQRHNPPPPADPPLMHESVTSEQLVAQFQREMVLEAWLPPALLPPAAPAPSPRTPAAAGPPPPPLPPPTPRWDRPLRLRAELRAHRADYTEPYSMWWDAESGASRVELHGGTAGALLQLNPDGTHQRLEYRVDNTGPEPVIRCGYALPARLSREELAPPALPDPSDFQFAGYTQEPEGSAEVWRKRVVGGVGEGGAARGEVLSFDHELVVVRDSDLATRPLRYSVSVDSSVLGPRCDSYEHRYVEARQQRPALQQHAQQCDAREQLSPQRVPAHAARLQPLREFTLPMRDTRYDVLLDEFKQEFSRDYADDSEEALRKNIFVQSTRFVLSGNRQGATFELGANFLSDRLAAELDTLLGVAEGADVTAEQFPHPPAQLQLLQQALPPAFDWRDEGGVSPVRYQGSCSSCWALAVTGAVEGAYFARTRRLVPLAEQALVDCAAPFGGNGCNGTWPSHAYDYVKARGLPALAQYGPHKERVETCRDRALTPVTHIGAHVNVTANSAPALRVVIRNHAPAVVIIDAKAKSFIFYKRGVLYDDRCAKAPPRLNHAVLAVGYGGGAGGDGGGEEYFTVKNSWSAAWGEAGYARLHAASNACGLLARASFPRLEGADVGDHRDMRRALDPS